jgi:L-arabinose isomerase
MKRTKFGYLPLYIKLYDDTSAEMREPMEAYMRSIVQMLRGEGFDIVLAPVCRIKKEFEQAIDAFMEQDVAAIITQHLAYSPSLESINALKRVGVPIIVLNTTPDYDLIDRAGYYNGINNNHGIHGVQDMCNLLRRNGVQYFLCTGHVLHSAVLAEVMGKCRATVAARAFKRARVGAVGSSFQGMGDFQIEVEEYKRSIGASVFRMSEKDIAEFLRKVSDEEINEEIALDQQKFHVNIKNAEAYRLATKAGLAVRKWADAMRLNALTINFLSLDKCGLPKMPFVECSKSMVRGLGYAGEGDVLTAGLVGALRSVYNDTTFVEMFCPDWKEDIVLLNHMGEGNPELALWKPSLIDKPFSYNSCGDTVAPAFCYRPGKAVWVNLAPSKDGFCFIVADVEMMDKGLQLGAYRDSVQGWMKPGVKLPEFLNAYSELGGTHHSALVYNAEIQDILAFGKMMNFEVCEI